MAIARKNQLMGLDIGSHSIKLVEVDHGKKDRILKNFGTSSLPSTAIVEGDLREPEIVATAIRTLADSLKTQNRDVAIALSGYPVVTKRLSVNVEEDQDLESLIQEKAEQYIPFGLEDVNLDYDVLVPFGQGTKLPELVDPSSAKMDIMLAAARRDVIDEYVAVVQDAGLNVAVLDVEAFAIQNAFEMSAADPTGCFALVHVGAEELSINIVKEGGSLFTRDSSYGGNQISEAIARRFQVNFEQAEKIKLGGRTADDETNLAELFQTAVAEWTQEIRQALDFAAGGHSQEVVEKIYLSGGSSRLPGFGNMLETELGITVEMFDPFTVLKVHDKRFDPEYLKYMAPQAVVAVGLAMRSIGDK